MKRAESPIFVKTYDLLVWMIPQLTTFPKDQRFRLAARLEDCLYEFHERLLRAARAADKSGDLREADILLEQFRIYLRLAQEIHCLGMQQYEYASRLTNEIGKLLGGWQKTMTANPAARAAERGDQP